MWLLLRSSPSSSETSSQIYTLVRRSVPATIDDVIEMKTMLTIRFPSRLKGTIGGVEMVNLLMPVP